MAIRKIYVNPGDMLDIRVIADSELPRNNAEWSAQTRPRSILLSVRDSDRIAFVDQSLRIDLENSAGKKLRHCN